MLLPLLLGCLINQDLYERRTDELLDADRDGHRSALEGGDDCDDTNVDIFPGASEIAYDGVDQDCNGGDLDDVDGDGAAGPSGVGEDCNDDDASVSPGAEDTCYDGVDSDCAEDDDDDCDGDGVPALATGGTDCDDSNPEVFPGATESWADLDTDDNCNGALSDQVSTPLSEVGTRIIPPTTTERFGNGVGTVSDLDHDGLNEVWITAPYEGGDAPYLGAVYLVRGADFKVGADIEVADPALVGTQEDELLGTSVSVGDVDGNGSPELYVSSIGRNDNAGTVYAVLPEDLDTALRSHPSTISSTSITGTPGDYLGTRIESDRDFDGDGVDDLLVEASGARTVALFSSLGPGEFGLTDADVSWVTEPGRWLSVTGLDDVDGDGVNDIGLVQGNTPTETIGAALYQGGASQEGGTFPHAAHVNFIESPSFGTFAETAGGDRVLVMLQWQASAFLDVEGGATYDVLEDADWEVYRDAEEGGFTNVSYTWLGSAGPSFLLTSPYGPTESLIGGCIVWSEGDWQPYVFAQDLPLSLVGDQPGDRACRSVAYVDDQDGDGESDLLVGADGAGVDDQGRAYLVLAP